MASTFNAAQGDTEAEKHDREQRRRQLHDVPLQATGGPDVWPRWEFMDEKLGPNGDLKTHMSSQMRIYLTATKAFGSGLYIPWRGTYRVALTLLRKSPFLKHPIADSLWSCTALFTHAIASTSFLL